MSKLKQPIISLGATGTLGDALTFQRSRGINTVRTKPTPAYRWTLPQAYWRYLYEDYCDFWNSLTTAQKEAWRSAGSTLGISPFNAFMRYYLKDLPDIVGWWHLDEGGGPIAHDSGKHDLDLTVIGATPVIGIIGRARYFDGINDELHIADEPALHTPDALTVMAHINTTLTERSIAGQYDAPGAQRSWILRTRHFAVMADPTAYNANYVATYPAEPIDGENHTMHGRWTAGEKAQGFLDGALVTQSTLVVPSIGDSTALFKIGTSVWSGIENFRGIIDEVIVYNRALPQTTITKQAERSYPTQ